MVYKYKYVERREWKRHFSINLVGVSFKVWKEPLVSDITYEIMDWLFHTIGETELL